MEKLMGNLERPIEVENETINQKKDGLLRVN